ncbi:MAG TPA: CVNH domain-containing protein [Longimicrobiaceae bacterium]|nr:CVNH domain-containing protein [Longimicrobiaceae bacterium]
MATHVYIANSLDQDVYVLPAEKTGWMLADIGFNVAALAVGIGEIRAVAMAGELPATLNTVKSLYYFLKIVASLGGSMFGAASAVTKATEAVLAQVKAHSIKVPAGQVVDVLSLSSFSNYTSLSGVFAWLGDAETFDLLVVTADGKQVTMVSTNTDYSWVVQSDRLVRTVYGTTWQPDPAAGLSLFNTGAFVPAGSYRQTCKDFKVMLACNARTQDGTLSPASIDITALTDVSFSNVDGSLVADGDTTRPNGFVPGGSYSRSCSDVSVVLSCQAQKADGSYQAATLDLTSLRSVSVSNQNGVLVSQAA